MALPITSGTGMAGRQNCKVCCQHLPQQGRYVMASGKVVWQARHTRQQQWQEGKGGQAGHRPPPPPQYLCPHETAGQAGGTWGTHPTHPIPPPPTTAKGKRPHPRHKAAQGMYNKVWSPQGSEYIVAGTAASPLWAGTLSWAWAAQRGTGKGRQLEGVQHQAHHSLPGKVFLSLLN